MFIKITKIFAVVFLSGWLFLNCRSSEIIEASDRPVFIAPKSDSCKTVNSYRQWNAFFGLIPVTRTRFGTLGSEVGYRIIKKHTWKDIAISLLGGFYVTVNTHTLELQRCEQDYIVTSKKDFAKQNQKMLYTALTHHAAQKSQGEESDLPVLFLTNGTSMQGIVLEVKPNAIVIGEKKELPVTGEMKNKDWILLKNGSVIFATDARYSDDKILYQLDGEKKEIATKELRKIRYMKSRSEAENTGHLTLIVPKEVANENILRLLLEPKTELDFIKTELKNSGFGKEEKEEPSPEDDSVSSETAKESEKPSTQELHQGE